MIAHSSFAVDTMNTILCIGLMICVSLALTSAYPASEAAQDAPVLIEDAPEVAAVEHEALQPEESRWGHGGWGHGGWGRGGHGWGHGGYGRGHGWGHGGGWGYGGGWGRGGWGR